MLTKTTKFSWGGMPPDPPRNDSRLRRSPVNHCRLAPPLTFQCCVVTPLRFIAGSAHDEDEVDCEAAAAPAAAADDDEEAGDEMSPSVGSLCLHSRPYHLNPILHTRILMKTLIKQPTDEVHCK